MFDNIHTRLENTCSALKHTPENVDLENLRMLLRECQEAIHITEAFKFPRSLRLEQTRDGVWEVEIVVSTHDVQELMSQLFSEDGT